METCLEHSGMEQAIKDTREENQELKQEVKILRNRLPIWASSLISLLTFALGYMVCYIEMIKHIYQQKVS